MRLITVSRVATERRRLGLCRTRDAYASGLDFYMGEQFDAPNKPEGGWARHFSPSFNEGALVGSIPGLMEVFGSKDAYSRYGCAA